MTHSPTLLSLHGRTIEAQWWHPPSLVDSSASFGEAGPPVVLLHEGLGSVSMWRDFPERLAQQAGRPVFAYSRWGHGGSALPPAPLDDQFMHREALETLPALLDAAAVEKAVLMGHSDGGSIALIFAATNPRRTAALVLEAPHVFVEDVSIVSIERARRLYETEDLRRRLARYHGANVDAAFHGWNDVWLANSFRLWNIEKFLPRVTCPMLLMQGEQDEYGTLAQVRAIEGQAGGEVETQILANCGHAPHRDQSDKVLARVAAFLRRHDL